MKFLSKEGLQYFLLKLKSWSNDTFINKNDTKEVYESDTEEVYECDTEEVYECDTEEVYKCDTEEVFTTDVENVSTIEVDTEPIEGSDNLITSGGVVSIVKNPIYPRVMTTKHGSSELSIGWNTKNKIKLTEYDDVKDCEQINVINSDNGNLISLTGHDNYNLVINNTNTVRKAAMYSGTYTYWKFYSIDEEDFVTFYETIDDIPQDVEIYLMTELAFGGNSYWVFLSSIIDSNRLKIGLISKEETTHWYEAVQKARDGECICYDDMETIITDKENIVWMFKYKSIENPEYVEKYAQKWVEKIATLGTGKNSVKFGEATNASGSNSAAFGSETSSVGNNQVVIGKNNREDENKLLIVGYGRSGNENNILTVDYDGNLDGAGIIRTSGDVIAFNTQDEEASLYETNKKVNDIWFGQKEEFLVIFGNDNPMNFDNGNFTTSCKIPRMVECKLTFKIDHNQDKNLIEYTLINSDVVSDSFTVDGATETISYTLRYNWSEETLEFIDLTHVSDQTKLNGSYYGNIKADYFKSLKTKSIHLADDKLVNYGGRIDFGDIDRSTGKGYCYIEETGEDSLYIYADTGLFLKNVMSPSEPRDAANKDYVDTVISELAQKTEENEEAIDNINTKIPTQASTTNQLADKDFVNSSIENVAAYFITKDADGNPFATKAELDAATEFYSGRQVRVPTRNDYTVVLADESKIENDIAPTTRYLYYNGWNYQYVVNNTALTAAQWKAINSGATAEIIGSIGSKQDSSERQTAIPDNADNNHYPTSKAVADYVESHGGGGAPTLLYQFEVAESATSFTQNVNIDADHYIVIFSWADPASATGSFRAYIRMNNNQEWIAYNTQRNANLGSVASVEVQKIGTNQIVDISCGFSRPTRNYGFSVHSQSRLFVDYMGGAVNQLYLDSNLDINGLEVDVYVLP